MLFYSPIFLFYFLPLSLLLVLVARGRWRDHVLLGCSMGFYFWGEPRFFFIAILSAVADFIVCRLIFRYRGTPRAQLFMALGIVLNVLLLVYFKYLDFLVLRRFLWSRTPICII